MKNKFEVKNLFITAELDFEAGTDIVVACRQAVDFASTNQCVVRFSFNGANMSVHYGEIYENVLEHYRVLTEPDYQPKFPAVWPDSFFSEQVNTAVTNDRVEILAELVKSYDITDDGIAFINEKPLPFPVK